MAQSAPVFCLQLLLLVIVLSTNFSCANAREATRASSVCAIAPRKGVASCAKDGRCPLGSVCHKSGLCCALGKAKSKGPCLIVGHSRKDCPENHICGVGNLCFRVAGSCIKVPSTDPKQCPPDYECTTEDYCFKDGK